MSVWPADRMEVVKPKSLVFSLLSLCTHSTERVGNAVLNSYFEHTRQATSLTRYYHVSTYVRMDATGPAKASWNLPQRSIN